MNSQQHFDLSEKFGAPNYAPLPVVLSRGEGAWVWDVDGKKYLDMLSAYSAVNFGHCHPRLVRRAKEQMDTLTLTSRAFFNDQYGPLCKELCELLGMEMAIFMNSGAEAVETAVKVSRRWGYERKGIPAEQAQIVVFSNNFHGRTTTIVSFSDSPESRRAFGPFTPGFTLVPYGDIEAAKAAITPYTAAVLLEPIQGEAGIILPPPGYLRQLRILCTEQNVLFIADEIQSGLGRAGTLLACDREGVVPDLVILGKSLGGGILPISSVVGRREILSCLSPGSHGSTFGGNPLACAIAREVLALITEENLLERVRHLEAVLKEEFERESLSKVQGIRIVGLWAGIDIKSSEGTAKDFCYKLKDRGILCKDTRAQTIRVAPPLTLSQEDLVWAISQFREVLR